MYNNGQGVQRDYAEAVKWSRLAAEQGFAAAQYDLAFACANGQGVPRNPDQMCERFWTLPPEAAKFVQEAKACAG